MQSGRSWMKIKHKKHNSPEGDEVKNAPVSPGHGDVEAAAGGAQTGAQPPDSAPIPSADASTEAKKIDDRYMRLMADFENFRKRTLREKNDVYRMANEDFILELLPALDHLNLAMEAARRAGAAPAILDGFRMVSEQLAAVMKKFGVEPIEAGGQEFDPTRHEAISHLASDTVPDHVVIQQTRRGYLLGDKLIRAAQVVVSSGPARHSEEPPPAEVPEDEEEE